jgi:hypothetical protein
MTYLMNPISAGLSQSQETDFSSQDLRDALPNLPQSSQVPTSTQTAGRGPYKKLPLTDPTLSSKTRRRRVELYRDTFTKWCEEQQCTTAELGGLLIHLDNYSTKRDLAQVGWSLFKGAVSNECQEASVLEGIWIKARCGLSVRDYRQLRLLFLGRFTFPPEYMISRNLQKMCPDLIGYKHGAKAFLTEGLSLTLMERLTVSFPGKAVNFTIQLII